MLGGRVALRLRSVVEGLTSSSRRVWWTSFLLGALLAGMWGVANPPFAGPDEPAHVIRAHALDHGQLTGDEPNSGVTKRRGDQDVLVVRAPSVYGTVNVACFAFQRY